MYGQKQKANIKPTKTLFQMMNEGFVGDFDKRMNNKPTKEVVTKSPPMKKRKWRDSAHYRSHITILR